ncbi:hypothetical protein HDC92_004978 [Pedobacter sp. AK017]|nr:hypothetical protein [Pedobacter sp. AK017]
MISYLNFSGIPGRDVCRGLGYSAADPAGKYSQQD